MTKPLSLVYFPVEELHRELDARLLTAHYLLGKGVPVVLGQSWLLLANGSSLMPGAILFKSLNNLPTAQARVLKGFGWLCFAVDEESLGLADAPYMQRDFCHLSGLVFEQIFSQSLFHRDAIMEKLAGRFRKISVTGNARLDILRPEMRWIHEEEAAKYRAKFGDYILVNTNLGFAHNIKTKTQYRNILINLGWMKDNSVDNALYDKLEAWDYRNRDLVRSVLKRLDGAELVNKIILRPHPIETEDAWSGVFDGCEKIEILREGSHLALIQASRMVLHTGCTTGLEAVLLDKPALSMLPAQGREDPWSLFVSNHVNNTAVGHEASVDKVLAHLSGSETLTLNETLEENIGRYAGSSAGAYASHAIGERLFRSLREKGIEIACVDPEQVRARITTDSLELSNKQRRKFSMSAEAFRNRAHRVFESAGQDLKVDITDLADDLFLLNPSQ